jgi:chloramphenicol 3-O phosphotransferase
MATPFGFASPTVEVGATMTAMATETGGRRRPRAGSLPSEWPPGAGTVVILNGTPRSGKTTIARAIQDSFDGVWMHLGVDTVVREMTPARYRPGIGLRPGGERPDLEAFVARSYAALYDSVAAHSRHGLHVVVDVGHHDAYRHPLHTLADAAGRLHGLPAYLVGVRCPTDVVLLRRSVAEDGRTYDATEEMARRWEVAVHRPGLYDLEVDTSAASPDECARAIRQRLTGPPPTALVRISARSG